MVDPIKSLLSVCPLLHQSFSSTFFSGAADFSFFSFFMQEVTLLYHLKTHSCSYLGKKGFKIEHFEVLFETFVNFFP